MHFFPSFFHTRYAPNTQGGRDFVVGNIDGQHDALRWGLWTHSFDPRRDRVFCVGNLTGYSPKLPESHSLECLALLQEPWFHAVLAEREMRLLQFFGLSSPHTDATRPDQVRPDLAAWLKTLNASQKHWLEHTALDWLLALPLSASIVGGPTPVHLVHAQLASDKGRVLQDEDLLAPDRGLSADALAAAPAFVTGGAVLSSARLAGVGGQCIGVRLTESPVQLGLSETYCARGAKLHSLVHQSHVVVGKNGPFELEPGTRVCMPVELGLLSPVFQHANAGRGF